LKISTILDLVANGIRDIAYEQAEVASELKAQEGALGSLILHGLSRGIRKAANAAENAENAAELDEPYSWRPKPRWFAQGETYPREVGLSLGDVLQDLGNITDGRTFEISSEFGIKRVGSTFWAVSLINGEAWRLEGRRNEKARGRIAAR
jgi:hypothetical protein